MFSALLSLIFLIAMGYYSLSITGPLFNHREYKTLNYLLYAIDVAVYCSIPILIIVFLSILFNWHLVKITKEINLFEILTISITALGVLIGGNKIINNSYRIGDLSSRAADFFIRSCAITSLIIITTIFLFLLKGSLTFFQQVPVIDFLFGTKWDIAAGVVNDNGMGKFGSLPLLMGTLMISFLSVAIAAPTGITVGIYLSVYCPIYLRKYLKLILELIAGVPSIVYGLAFVISMLPLLDSLWHDFGIHIAPDSALIASIAMAIMIFPIIATLTDDILNAVPKAEVKGALSMGTTMYEVVKTVMIPRSMPGIISGIILAFSRVVGETMLVVMILGINSNMSLNPLESVSTITVHIVNILTGEQSFDSNATRSVFALGLLLFLITLVLNIIARRASANFKYKYS